MNALVTLEHRKGLDGPDNVYLTEADVAARYNLSIKTLQAWRLKGVGPKHSKLIRNVRYHMGALLEWEATCQKSSTSG